MKKTTLSLFVMLILTAKLQSQSFLNGNFEITTANCELNISNSSFNGFMSNCYGFGAPLSYLDIVTASCGYGSAQNGNYYIGIACAASGTLEAFSLALSSPLIVGQTYVLSFYNRMNGYPTNKLKIGYSLDSLSFGTLIDSIAPPDSNWDYELLTFSPVNNSSFITVTVLDSTFSWNLVDNFTLTNSTGINNINGMKNTFSLFPNPANAVLNISSSKFDNISIISLLGKVLMEKTFTSYNEETIPLDISFLSSGIYFIKVGNEVRRFVKE